MIKVIKPSPYDSVWYLDPGVPPDGTGYSFDDPILFQLQIKPLQSWRVIRVRLAAAFRFLKGRLTSSVRISGSPA